MTYEAEKALLQNIHTLTHTGTHLKPENLQRAIQNYKRNMNTENLAVC